MAQSPSSAVLRATNPQYLLADRLHRVTGMPRLRLEPVTRANVRAACQLTVRPDQEGLVAPVAWSIASAYTVPDIAWPRLIYDGDQLVGFIMAAFDPQNPDPHCRAYLWRLNIGGDRQGRGYGQFAVDALCQEALRRGQDKLTVSYHPGGQRALGNRFVLDEFARSPKPGRR